MPLYLLLFIFLSSSLPLISPSSPHCSSCKWLSSSHSSTPPTTHTYPHLGLIYIHMRKSGGTTFLRLFKQWMIEHSCIDSANRGTGFLGYTEGVMRSDKEGSSNCTGVDMRHEEFKCLDPHILKALLKRNDRENIPFSYFTILRDPIERIGGQAFYGNAVGHIVTTDIALKWCYDGDMSLRTSISSKTYHDKCQNPRKADKTLCECLKNAFAHGMKIMATNSTLWFDWFRTSVGFQDNYMPNYYTRRLVTGRATSDQISALKSAAACIKGSTCRTNTNVLSGLLPSASCPVHGRRLDSSDLEAAKRILKEQFDFVFLEMFQDPISVRIIAKVLREPSLELVTRLVSGHANTGLIEATIPSITIGETAKSGTNKRKSRRTTSTIYQHFMPQEVVDFLRKDNAADIELYNYAKELFEQRREAYT